MLRIMLLSLGIFACTCVPAQTTSAPEQELNAPIRTVTVYLDGAQVRRSTEARISVGRSTLLFTGITTGIDPGSIQVKTDNDELLILSVSHRIDYYEVPERSDEEQDIYDRIEGLEDRRRRLETELIIAKEEEQLLKANRDLSGSETGLDAEDLERGVRFHRERITAIQLTYLALSDSLRAIKEDRELLQKQLAELGKDREQPATSEVVIVLEADRELRTELELSYLVADAAWTPSYDVRVADISQPIDLRYRAEVRQQTGEDWTDVQLTLSTGDPTISAEAPELRTWRIRPGQRPPVYTEREIRRPVADIRTVTGKVTDAEGMPLIGASIQVPGSTTGTVTDLDGNYEIALPEGAEELTLSYLGYESKTVDIVGGEMDLSLEEDVSRLDEVVVVGYGVTDGLQGRVAGVNIPDRDYARRKQQQDRTPVPTQTVRRATTVTFAIELPYTIPSDGKERSVAIQRYSVPADYRHLAVPKRTEDVYLSAVVRDWERFDFISGTVQLFFDGTYLGDAFLDVDKTADSLVFSLGRDPGVVVSREADTDYQKRGGLLGSKRVESMGWTIVVRNTKSVPIDLTMIDQVPVSGDSRIDIDADIPELADYNEETGKVRWHLTLPPAEERKFAFGYEIKFSDYVQVYIE